MTPNPVFLLQNTKRLAAPPEKPTTEKLVIGEISKQSGDDYYAILPSYSTTYNYGPLELRGSVGTPAVGDKCLVGFDNEKTPYLLWYENEAGSLSTAANYEGYVTRTNDTEYEPSATTPTFVLVKALGVGSGSPSMTVYVGSVIVFDGSDASPGSTCSFICPAGKTWKCEATGKEALIIESNYLPL